LFGVAGLALGVVALALGQPFAVGFPLLLGGVITAGVSGGLLLVMRRRYEQVELRRMTSVDVAAAGGKGLAPSH